MMRLNNGLGIVILVTIMAVTPLVPAAVSAPQPLWVWDADGRVHDTSGLYRSISDEEACLLYGFCKELKKESVATESPVIADGGGGDSSGGCP